MFRKSTATAAAVVMVVVMTLHHQSNHSHCFSNTYTHGVCVQMNSSIFFSSFFDVVGLENTKNGYRILNQHTIPRNQWVTPFECWFQNKSYQYVRHTIVSTYGLFLFPPKIANSNDEQLQSYMCYVCIYHQNENQNCHLIAIGRSDSVDTVCIVFLWLGTKTFYYCGHNSICYKYTKYSISNSFCSCAYNVVLRSNAYVMTVQCSWLLFHTKSTINIAHLKCGDFLHYSIWMVQTVNLFVKFIPKQSKVSDFFSRCL